MTSVGTLLGSSKIFVSHITILNERKKNEIREAGTPATEKQGRLRSTEMGYEESQDEPPSEGRGGTDNNAEDDVPERSEVDQPPDIPVPPVRPIRPLPPIPVKVEEIPEEEEL